MKINKFGILLIAAGILALMLQQGMLGTAEILIMAGIFSLIGYMYVGISFGLLFAGCMAMAVGIHSNLMTYYNPLYQAPMLFALLGLGAVLSYLTAALRGFGQRWALSLGVAFTVLSGVIFYDRLYGLSLPSNWFDFWPLILVLAGLWLIYSSMRNNT